MKTSELRIKTETELKEVLKKLRKDLSETRINWTQGKEKNIKKSLLLRRQIAKVLTLEKEGQVLKETK